MDGSTAAAPPVCWTPTDSVGELGRANARRKDMGGVHEHMRKWEPEEDRLLIETLGMIGPRWAKIAARVGRSVASIRNRWQRINKGHRLLQEGGPYRQRCVVCGEPRRGHVCFAQLRDAPSSEKAEICQLPDAPKVTKAVEDKEGWTAGFNEYSLSERALTSSAVTSTTLPARPPCDIESFILNVGLSEEFGLRDWFVDPGSMSMPAGAF